MQIYYFQRGDRSNFGDDLNRWLWEELAPGKWSSNSDVCFAGIGTIISQDLLSPWSKWVVFGSGAGYSPLPQDFGSSRWKVVALRGPLSCKILGHPSRLGVIDGAALISSLPRLKPLPDDRRSGIAFMPHFESVCTGHWEKVCTRAGIEYLDPHAPSELLVERIRKAKLVLADAMHAAIVADSLRVPWIPLMTSPHINAFKWLDWTLSVDAPYRPIMLPPSSMVEVLRNRTLGWYGERYGTAMPSVDDVLRDYEQLRLTKEKWWWPVYSQWCRRLVSSVPRELANSRCAAGWRLKSDEPYIDKAATALLQAAASSSYLSSDRILVDHVEDLTGRFHALMRTSDEAISSEPSFSDDRLFGYR